MATFALVRIDFHAETGNRTARMGRDSRITARSWPWPTSPATPLQPSSSSALPSRGCRCSVQLLPGLLAP